MTDLVERLREMGEHPCRSELPMGADLREAADRIEQLKAEIARKDALIEKVAQAAIDASAEVITANVISYETNGVVLRPRTMQDATSQTYGNAIRALSASEIVKKMCGE